MSANDAPRRCGHCAELISDAVSETWLWELIDLPRQMVYEWRHTGPFHLGCAMQLAEDDDTRYSMTEPDQEPSDRKLESYNGVGDTDTNARAIREAGR